MSGKSLLITSSDNMKEISKIEELCLLTIWRQKDNAYGVTIRRNITELTLKEYSYGTIYSLLDQLLNKGLVDKFEGDPTNERGGRRKLFYKITTQGKEALKNAYEMQRKVWGELSNVSFDM